jgi:hypothetical protein
VECKDKAKREGRDVPEALVEMITNLRKRYD